MLILRLILILSGLLLLVNVILYLVTRDTRYKYIAWQTVRFTGLLLSVFVILVILERYVLRSWNVLL